MERPRQKKPYSSWLDTVDSFPDAFDNPSSRAESEEFAWMTMGKNIMTADRRAMSRKKTTIHSNLSPEMPKNKHNRPN